MTLQNTGQTLKPTVVNGRLLNNTSQQLAIRRSQQGQVDYIPHITFEDVKRICAYLDQDKTNGERNRLLVQLLFDGCLRVSEAVGSRPQDIAEIAGGWRLNVIGKGGGYSVVAISANLAAQLQAFAYRKNIDQGARIFEISRSRVHQIITAAYTALGITKPEHVGAVHVLRHSGALERLRRTGNPKAVQEQLRHRQAEMTLRYMKTLGHDDALKIQSEVDYSW